MWSDMFAVALLAAFLWDGKTPNERPAAQIKVQETGNSKATFTQQLMQRCLNPEPRYRPAAGIVIIELDRFAAQPAPVSPAASGSGEAAQVDQDVLEKLREFEIEDAAPALAKHGFKKLRTLKRMEDRYLHVKPLCI